MKKIRIELYETPDGDCPYEKWFFRLTSSIRAVVQSRLDRIGKSNFGDIKKIVEAKGLYEIRLHIGPGYRIYFTKIGGEIIILLCGGMKKSQLRDIKKAQEYLMDYLKRKKQ